LDISFIIITVLIFLFFYIGNKKNKTVFFTSLLWILIVSLLSISGFFLNTEAMPPRFIVVFAGNIIFVAYLLKTLKSNSQDNRYSLLIHILRIPIEIILYQLFLAKEVPVIMTYHGWNYDILIGVSAILLIIYLFFFKRNLPKYVLLIWNYIGLLFLINIVIIAILSAPLPVQQFAFDQPNLAVIKFPYILLPAFIVPVVFLTHILAIKKLSSSYIFKHR